MSYALETTTACGFDTTRPLVIAGNGPSLLSLDYRQLPDNACVFRCNWFFLEDHYRFGRNVDAYFWSVHNEGMLRGLEEAVRIGGYRIGAYFSPVVFKEFSDESTLCSKLSFSPAYNHWRIIAGNPTLAADMMARPLPTQGIQMVATALELGFRDIHLVGMDFYQDPHSRYAWQVPPSVADAWLGSKDLTPGYEACHEMAVDLRMLQHCMDWFPDARIRNLGRDNPLLPKCTEIVGTGASWLECKDRAEPVSVTPSRRKLYQEVVSADGTRIKRAFVTWVDAGSVHAVAALANSLLKVSEAPLIVMLPPGTDLGLIPGLENIRIHFAERLGGASRDDVQGWISESVLNVFGLDFLDRAVFLAAETLVLQNIDSLFEHGEFAAAPDFGRAVDSAEFDASVFVCSPSRAVFSEMRSKLAKDPVAAEGASRFLNRHMRKFTRLDRKFNTQRQVAVDYPEVFESGEIAVLNLRGREIRFLFEPGNDVNLKHLVSLWFSFLPDESKIALLHEFRAVLTGESSFNVRVAHKHFEIDGMIPKEIRTMEPLELKPIEMARALIAMGRQDLAKNISEVCLRRNPASKSHQAIVRECSGPSSKPAAPAKSGA